MSLLIVGLGAADKAASDVSKSNNNLGGSFDPARWGEQFEFLNVAANPTDLLETNLMDLKLSGQTAAIVGAAHGIGLAIARGFAQEGAGTLLLDIDGEAAEREAGRIKADYEMESRGRFLDVTDDDSIQAALDRVDSVRHLVYAAGTGSGKFGFPFWNLTPDDWPRAWDVNLHGAVRVLHQVRPQLTQHAGSSVLFIASIAGQIGSQTDPPYSAAKAAMLNFAQCAARDLAPFDVRVNSICPGMVKTKLNESVWRAWRDQAPDERSATYEQWAEDKIKQVAPLGRWQDPEDIAAVAVFLASPVARNITGQTINVDGGQVM